jgi:hypothetical protein
MQLHWWTPLFLMTLDANLRIFPCSHIKWWFAWYLNPIFGYRTLLLCKPGFSKYFPSFRDFYEKWLCISLLFCMCLILCSSHTPFFIRWIILTRSGDEYKLWSSFLCRFFVPVTSYFWRWKVDSSSFNSSPMTRQFHYWIGTYFYRFPWEKNGFLQVYIWPMESITPRKKCPVMAPFEGTVLSHHNVIMSFELNTLNFILIRNWGTVTCDKNCKSLDLNLSMKIMHVVLYDLSLYTL